MEIKNDFYGTMTYKMTKLATLNALCVILLAEDYNYVKVWILLTLLFSFSCLMALRMALKIKIDD